MNKAERLSFISELIESTTEALERMKAEQETYTRALIGSNTVIRTSKSLYIVAETGPTPGTVQYRPTGLSSACRWSLESAQRIALELQQSLNVGPHWQPELVSIHQALRDEIRNYSAQLDQYKEMRESIEQQPE